MRDSTMRMSTARLLIVFLTLGMPARAQSAAPAKKILFGIQTGQQDTTYADLVNIWKTAEALGFDSAWNFDHLAPIRGSMNNPCLEGWTLLSALAAHTTKLRIG